MLQIYIKTNLSGYSDFLSNLSPLRPSSRSDLRTVRWNEIF